MDSQVMPMYAGYAIGNIIKEDDLMLPILIKDKERLDRELDEQISIKEQIDKKNKSNQDSINACNREINRIQTTLKDLTSRIEELYGKLSLFSIQETLPIDVNSVKVRIENNGFQSERMNHIIFDSSIDDVRSRVRSFINDLFLGDTRSSYLPSGTLDSVVNHIERMTNTQVKVSLVGSFVTLTRVRTIEPVVLRRNAIISDELLAKVDDYCVLTEAVLGAVFIAVGKSLSISKPLSESTDKKTLSSLSTLSFISQGAIPRIGTSIEDVTVWSIYCQWKEDLKNEHAGYPIRFKFKKLKNVLQESNLYPLQPHHIKPQEVLTNSSLQVPLKSITSATNIKIDLGGVVEDIL